MENPQRTPASLRPTIEPPTIFGVDGPRQVASHVPVGPTQPAAVGNYCHGGYGKT